MQYAAQYEYGTLLGAAEFPDGCNVAAPTSARRRTAFLSAKPAPNWAGGGENFLAFGSGLHSLADEMNAGADLPETTKTALRECLAEARALIAARNRQREETQARIDAGEEE